MHGRVFSRKRWGPSCNGLPPGYDEVRTAFEARVSELRGKALNSPAHARTPEIVANLQAGFDLFLDYAVAFGSVNAPERECLAQQCWEALCDAAAAQAKHHAAMEPTARFLDLLRASLSSGRAHLQSREGTIPERAPGACGWRSIGGNWSPSGDCIGWVDGDALYLEPTAACRVVQTAARDMGEPFPTSEQTLKKRLHEKGLLASIDKRRETLTVRRSIAGSNKPVLHFLRSTLLPEAPNEDEDEGIA
jgi:hypothetical protein